MIMNKFNAILYKEFGVFGLPFFDSNLTNTFANVAEIKENSFLQKARSVDVVLWKREPH